MNKTPDTNAYSWKSSLYSSKQAEWLSNFVDSSNVDYCSIADSFNKKFNANKSKASIARKIYFLRSKLTEVDISDVDSGSDDDCSENSNRSSNSHKRISNSKSEVDAQEDDRNSNRNMSVPLSISRKRSRSSILSGVVIANDDDMNDTCIPPLPVCLR